MGLKANEETFEDVRDMFLITLMTKLLMRREEARQLKLTDMNESLQPTNILMKISRILAN